MALSDDHPIQVTASNYKTAGDSDLLNWLNKEAEGTTSTVADDLYSGPPAVPAEHEFPSAASAHADKQDMAQAVLNNAAGSTKADRALLAANFKAVASGEAESSAIALQGSKTAAASTLSDFVQGLGIGRG